MVYKVMAQRDTEIHRLKANKKVHNYNLLKGEYNKLKDMVRNYSSKPRLQSPKLKILGKIKKQNQQLQNTNFMTQSSVIDDPTNDITSSMEFAG